MITRTPSIICHISDTHGFAHKNLCIPACDFLIHSGDLTNIGEPYQVIELFKWFRNLTQVRNIVFIAGNHDLSFDKDLNYVSNDSIGNLLRLQKHRDILQIINSLPSHIYYLNNSEVTINGLKIWGSPVTPTFGKGWAFNRDTVHIKKEWSKIPSDIDILVTHGPVYGQLDKIPEKFKRTPDEDIHRGCPGLLNVIKKRLRNLKLHCGGHIHDQIGVISSPISNTRNVLFSNACVVDNNYKQAIIHPFTITI